MKTFGKPIVSVNSMKIGAWDHHRFPVVNDRGVIAYSFYCGIAVIFDRDRDERIFNWMDALPETTLQQLVAVTEIKGGLFLAWENRAPRLYRVDEMVDVPPMRPFDPKIEVDDGIFWDGTDYWNICESFRADDRIWDLHFRIAKDDFKKWSEYHMK